MGPPGARWGPGSTANCLLNIKSEWGPLEAWGPGGMGPLELEPYEEPMRPQSSRRPLNREKMGLFEDYGAPWSYMGPIASSHLSPRASGAL